MSLLISGTLANVYTKEGFLDKETGEIGETKLRLQIQTLVPTKEGGKKIDLMDISCPLRLQVDLEKLLGKEIIFPVGVTSSGNRVFFFCQKIITASEFRLFSDTKLKPF